MEVNFAKFSEFPMLKKHISTYWLYHYTENKTLHFTQNVSKGDKVPENSYFLWNVCKISLITKTRLYNFDLLKPHFYVVKLGFTGVYILCLISAQNINCGHSLEPPRRGGSNEYPQSMFWAEIWKISEIFIWKFSVFGGEFFYIFE